MALVKCVIKRISTDKIINDNYMVDESLLSNLNLDPDLECLAVYEPYAEPPFDARKFKLNISKDSTTDPHPTYPSLNAYAITYSEISRSTAELKQSALTEMINANQLVYNGYRMDELTIKAIPILGKKIKKDSLEDWENDIIDINEEIAAKIQSNESVYELMVEAIDAGEEFDLDLGWIKE